MQIGVHVPTTVAPDVTRDALLTFAREAEARGFASLWVSDHIVIPTTTDTDYPGGGRRSARALSAPPPAAAPTPSPRRRPPPPIWVGGISPAALRRVVALGDGWHAMSSKSPAEIAASVAELKRLAEAARRPWSTI